MFKTKVILEGIVGSHAYGLATPESDIDYRGSFIESTKSVLGIFGYQQTIDRNDPDICLHEVGKFIKLLRECNPNILEMLYLPTESYTTLTWEGKMLIFHRNDFLSNRVADTYGGYAKAQIERVNRKSEKMHRLWGRETIRRVSQEFPLGRWQEQKVQGMYSDTKNEILLGRPREELKQAKEEKFFQTGPVEPIAPQIRENLKDLRPIETDVRFYGEEPERVMRYLSDTEGASSRSLPQNNDSSWSTLPSMQSWYSQLEREFGDSRTSQELLELVVFIRRRLKAARHCIRLIDQGKQLLETGTLTVKVDNPEYLFEVGKLPPEKLSEVFEAKFAKYKSAVSVLPDKPNDKLINDLLIRFRMGNWS